MEKSYFVFFDIVIGSKSAGRLVFELFKELTPQTAENFRRLCTGDYDANPGEILQHYLDSIFYEILPGQYWSGGDIDGSGGVSIYGQPFPDESFSRRHTHAGVLSMANTGPNTNTSLFNITFAEWPQLDNKWVVFGQVIEGMNVLKEIEKVPTKQGRPLYPVKVFKCGELDSGRDHINIDSFGDHLKIYRGIQEKRAQERERIIKEIDDAQDPKPDLESDPEMESDYLSGDMPPAVKQALYENQLAVRDELEGKYDQLYKKFKANTWVDHKQHKQVTLDLLGISKEYLLDTPIATDKRRTSAAPEWSIPSEDPLIRSYMKRIRNLKVNKSIYEEQRADPEIFVDNPAPIRIEAMQEELKRVIDKRAKFSKRKTFYEEADVSFINKRNRAYNLKLKRNFEDITSENRANLERRTATD